MQNLAETDEFESSKDTFRIRDILHGYISIDKEDQALLACPLVQRLRYIRQNDLGFLVFPTLNTSRFEHSLGVMHLAGRLAESALANAGKVVSEKYLNQLAFLAKEHQVAETASVRISFRRAARWYGLLHDLGHLPFCHLAEHAVMQAFGKEVVKRLCDADREGCKQPHEAVGSLLVEKNEEIKSALNADPLAAWMVGKLMNGKDAPSLLQPLKDIMDSEVDADRLDSTARDGKLSGGDFGHYDIDRLVQNARLHPRLNGSWKIMLTTRAVGPMEGLLMERYKTHRWIHFHPKVMALKGAFKFCVINLTKQKPDLFHWTRYYRVGEGFFDDAELLREIWQMNITSEPLEQFIQYARDSVLLRKETSFPLWKRSDEFRQICQKIVIDINNPDWIADNVSYPVINRLFHVWGVNAIEERLNRPGASGAHFLVMKTYIDLVKWRDEKHSPTPTSLYEVLLKSEDDPISLYLETPLSRQSGLVQSFNRIPSLEPAISVCILNGEGDRDEKARLKGHFIFTVSEMLKEKYSKPSE